MTKPDSKPESIKLLVHEIVDAVKLKFTSMIDDVPIVPCDEATELILRFAVLQAAIELISLPEQISKIHKLEEIVYTIVVDDLERFINNRNTPA